MSDIITNKVKEFRLKKKLTQDELASKVGITRPYLSEIERGKKKPGTDIAINIAKELNTTVEKLFFTKDVHLGEQRGCMSNKL